MPNASGDESRNTQLDQIEREIGRRRAEHLAGHIQARRRRLILRRLLIGCACVSALFAGIFIFNFIRLNSDVIEGHVKQGLMALAQGRVPFHVRKISGDLLTGIEIEDLVVQNPHFTSGGLMLSIPRITLRYSLWDVFWGRVVLERLIISNPVIVLARDTTGRAIWDFSTSAETGANATDTVPAVAAETGAPAEAGQTEEIADRYLQHIELKNVSLLVPRPRDLFSDQTLMRLLKIPPGNLQLAGMNLLLRKYPHPDFFAHVLRISTPDNPAWLTMQISRTRSTDDITASIEALKQAFDLSIRNLGDKGRHMQIFDRRRRERLNIEMTLAKQNRSSMENIRGLNGVIEFDDLAGLEPLLPSGSHLNGSFKLTASAAEDAGLIDSRIDLRIAGLDLSLPDSLPISHLNLAAGLLGRQAAISRFDAVIASMSTSHIGGIDFRNPTLAVASFASNLGGEEMLISGEWRAESKTQNSLHARIQRNAGQAEVSVSRLRERGLVRYGKISLAAGIRADGSLWDVLPLRLLPKTLTSRMTGYFSRVDLIGPLRIDAEFPGMDRMDLANAVVDLDGARIVSRDRVEDKLMLGGRVMLSSGSIELASLSARLDTLVVESSGRIILDASGRKPDSYAVSVISKLLDGKAFAISGSRFWRSTGLKG
ncbi:MAG TPA: hypothetical protein PKM25_12250, partial [Candidatus Ozemobacteraceae bacterium]|nr:hypothetical protein [Candidatus Ozemobacteraceae bacterium]